MIEKYKKTINKKLPEIIAIMSFAIAYIVVSIYHEPWFDEAQAWQIAKCASIREILFDIPHYEGHPPLWHLILAIPAKLGLPYEISLKTVGFIISFACAYLIIFKSPFPRIVRLALPFNYFIFYQYGIIVRPYGLLLLLMLLLAVEFKNRNRKPQGFVSILALICLTHSYGIMIACGISICFLLEILEENGIKRLINELFKDKRTLSLLGLLILAIIIIILIFPRKDTFYVSINGRTPFAVCLLCTLFTLLPECLCTTMNWSMFDRYVIQYSDVYTWDIAPSVIVGLYIWFAIFCLSSKKSFKYFALPSILLAVFCAAVYMIAHHVGVALGILLFWLWITLLDEDRFAGWKFISSKSGKGDSKLILGICKCIVMIFLIIPIYWSASASMHDIEFQYSPGKEIAEYLKKTGLDNALIYMAWENPDEYEDVTQVLFCNADSATLAYYDHNLFANTNDGDTEKAYTVYACYTREQIEQKFKDWREIGIPDVMCGYAEMSCAFGDKVSIFDYSPVLLARYANIYKNNTREKIAPILLRNDLLSEYDVKVQDTSGYLTGYIKLTDEMITAFKNGEITIDELLDTTLGSFGKE